MYSYVMIEISGSRQATRYVMIENSGSSRHARHMMIYKSPRGIQLSTNLILCAKLKLCCVEYLYPASASVER